MLLYDDEYETKTKENKNRTIDKIELQNIHYMSLNEISSLSLLGLNPVCGNKLIEQLVPKTLLLNGLHISNNTVQITETMHRHN